MIHYYSLRVCTPRWMDGSPVVFEAWQKNQPSLLNSEEHCVSLTPLQGKTIILNDKLKY